MRSEAASGSHMRTLDTPAVSEATNGRATVHRPGWTVRTPPVFDHVATARPGQETLAALERHIRDLRRDLAETVDLIERLRASCLSLRAKIDAAEREHERLVSRF